MIDIKRGRGIKIDGDAIIHAYWVDDGNPESGETEVTAACGAWARPEQAKEVDDNVDCMACLVLLPIDYPEEER